MSQESVTSSATTITGTYTEIHSVYTANTAGTISGLGNEAVTISDTSLAVSALNTLDGNTTGAVNAATVLTASDLTLLAPFRRQFFV